MKYQAYERYKESGVEWLGEIPERWQVKKLKFLAKIQPSNIDKKTKEGELPIVLCNYTDVYYNDTVDASLDFMKASATEEQIEKFTLKAGDTIITKDSEDPNDIAIPTFVEKTMKGVVCGYHLSMIRPDNTSYGAYIKRVFECHFARAYFATRSNGLTRYGLGSFALDNVIYPRPSESEAIVIADFLDHETAKIDTLIEKQQQLIKLLKEKRQAVISHAVTKGLNPEAPMRDSGVEWLGEVPEHWNVCRMKQVSSFITSGPRGWSDYLNESGKSIFLQSGDLNYKLGLRLSEAKKVSPPNNAEGVRTKLEFGDVVVCITGANTGRVAVTSALTATVYINQHLSLIRPIKRLIDSEYLGYVLSSRSIKSYFAVTQYGLKEGLSLANIAEIPLCYPTYEEQQEIVQYLKCISDKYDTLEGRTFAQVQLLKERRTALISAAVTGKIDVRNWQPAKPENHNSNNNKEVVV